MQTTQATNKEDSNLSNEEKPVPGFKRDPNYIKFMEMIAETQRKNRETLNSIQNSLTKISETKQILKDTNDSCEKFHDRTYYSISSSHILSEANKLFQLLGDNLTKTMLPPHKRKAQPGEDHLIPKVSNADSVLKELVNKSHIVVLTGAGLSAASNIPTFRGAGGYWTLRNSKEQLKAIDFLRHSYFLQSPEEIWRWHHEFKKVQAKNTPNVSHHALAGLQVLCKQEGSKMKCTMITQNIDAYHVEALEKANKDFKQNNVAPVIKPLLNEKKPVQITVSTPRKPTGITQKQAPVKVAPKKSTGVKKGTTTDRKKMNELLVNANKDETKKVLVEERKSLDSLDTCDTTARSDRKTHNQLCDDVFEIHGSINLMRCDQSCTNDFFELPSGCPDDFVPKCPNCQGMARPHTLFFDESYQEEFYRGASLINQIESMDCLIVIGTALETSLAARIVGRAIENNVLIIEINPEPCIEYGNVRHLAGKSEEFIPFLCEGVQKHLKAKANKI